MNCKNCNVVIVPRRKALGYDTCINCSDTEEYGCVNIVNHKTGNTVQVMSKADAASINKIGDRKRFGTVLRGGSRSDAYNPKRTLHKVSMSTIGSEGTFQRVGEQAVYLWEAKGIMYACTYIQRQVAECAISKSQGMQIHNILHTLEEVK